MHAATCRSRVVISLAAPCDARIRGCRKDEPMPRSEEAQHAYNMRRRVQRCIDKVDPRISLGQCDGELFDGPALEVLYRRVEVRDGVYYSFHDDAIPED